MVPRSAPPPERSHAAVQRNLPTATGAHNEQRRDRVVTSKVPARRNGCLGGVVGRGLQHLIVVVPGIGGSVLSDDRGHPVWGDARRRIVQMLADPDRLSVDHAPVLHPTALMASAGYIPPFRLHGYDGLVKGLRTKLDVDGPVRVDTATTLPGRERDLRADVVLFPYDFRYGVQAAAERLAIEVTVRLAARPAGQRKRRVIVIGHSMGGLVARYWATLPGQAATCRAILTLGTPHLGAPKALDWLINGAALGPGPVHGATARLLAKGTRVLRGWQGTFDLLPTYHAIQDKAGSGGDRLLRPADLMTRLASGFAVDPAYAAGAGTAARMHEHIAAGWTGMDPAIRPPIVPFLARGHGTPSAVYLRGRVLTITDTDPDWQPNVGWRGDGTVPAISAIPAELKGQGELVRPVTQRHSPMVSAGAVIQAMRDLTGDNRPVQGDEAERPRLGADIPDAIVLGDELRIGARLVVPADADGREVSLWLIAESADRSKVIPAVRMKRNEDGWTVGFMPIAAGAWRVRIEAAGLTGGPAPHVEDTVAVMSPTLHERMM